MTLELPAPMTPPDCDLQDFAFMPVDVRRLLKSETWALANGDQRAAATALWFESWHQVPAASLPSNEGLQARLADTPRWAKVKEQALRGWVLCSDGRLYHPVVAEKALEAWIEKLLSLISGAHGNAKRWKITVDTTVDEERLRVAINLLAVLQPKSRTLRKKAVLQILSPSAANVSDECDTAAQTDSGCDTGADSGVQSGGESGGDQDPDRNRHRQGHRHRQGSLQKNPSGSSEPRKRGTRKCPAGFEVTSELIAWAAEEAPLADWQAETAMLRDHEFRDTHTDWDGVWRNWMRRANKAVAEKRRPGVSTSNGSSKHGGFADKNYREGIEADGSFK